MSHRIEDTKTDHLLFNPYRNVGWIESSLTIRISSQFILGLHL